MAFTVGAYTGAVVETNKPAGDMRAIRYTSGNEAIATVNDKGEVSFVNPGTVTITAAKSEEGSHPQVRDSYILYITTKPADKEALFDEIQRAVDEHGNTVNLNYIDTSGIIDMSRLLAGKITFNGDISGWDVSSVTNMGDMFADANAFNQDISEWKVGKVTDMETMFFGAKAFNQDISKWDVSKVTNMNSMFRDAAAFDQDISGWDVKNVIYVSSMFQNAEAFSQNLDAWGAKLNPAITNSWFKTTLMFTGSGLASNLPEWCKESDCRTNQ